MDYSAVRKQIDKLIKAGQLDEALRVTLELRKIYWNDAPLHSLINRLKKKLRKVELKKRKVFIREGLKATRSYYAKGEYDSAIRAAGELLSVDSENGKAKKLLHSAKIHFIDQKLKDPLQAKWLAEKKYEKLYLFYQKLKKVFPEHSKLNKQIKIVEKQMIAQDRENKRVFANEALAKLREMFGAKKYEDVIQAAVELIAFTHEGLDEAKHLLEKAQRENEREIERDTERILKEKRPLLREAFKAKTEAMIRV